MADADCSLPVLRNTGQTPDWHECPPLQVTSPMLTSFAGFLSSHLSSPKSWEEGASGSATAGDHGCPTHLQGVLFLCYLKRHQSPTERQFYLGQIIKQFIPRSAFSLMRIFVKIFFKSLDVLGLMNTKCCGQKKLKEYCLSGLKWTFQHILLFKCYDTVHSSIEGSQENFEIEFNLK